MTRSCKYLAAWLSIAVVLLMASRAQENGQYHVSGARVTGQVLSADKRPVSGATVCLESQDGKSKWSAATDASGKYTFAGIPSGVYHVRVRATDHLRTSPATITIADGREQRVDISVQADNKPGLKASDLPEYSDKPEFTVAGVIDTTNLGGHGSDTITRTNESLASDVATLAGRSSERNGSARWGSAAQGDASNDENTYQLALRYRAAGDNERARQTVRELLAHNDRAELHHLLADIDEQAGDPLEAVREYQTAAEMDPSEPNLFDWAAELLLHRALEPSLQVFTKGNRLFPQSVRMLEGLAVALYAAGSYDEAVSRLCKASDMNVEDAGPYLLMGKMLTAQASSSALLNTKLERFVAVQPRSAMARYYYALSLAKTNSQVQSADNRNHIESLLREAVQLDPKLAPAYLQMGIMRSQTHDLPGAIAAYRKATEADPQLTEAHYRLAQAYRLSGEPAKSQAELNEYQRLSKLSADENERKRHEIRQFVYALRTRQ